MRRGPVKGLDREHLSGCGGLATGEQGVSALGPQVCPGIPTSAVISCLPGSA